MKERMKGCRSRFQRNRRVNTAAGCIVLVLIIAAAGFTLTKDKAQKTVAKDVKVENKGCEEMETNPLEAGTHPEVTKAVQDYYTRLAENTDFVEGYHNVQAFTKAGKYEGTYVAFVRYDMKIKDIYTEVPGLGTLYVEPDEDTKILQVNTHVVDEEIKDYVRTVAAHGDVKELMSGIQTDYANAVASDALLQEALQDLKNAYEDSTGNEASEAAGEAEKE